MNLNLQTTQTIIYPLQYKRRKTRVVPVGYLNIGSDFPILMQTMLTTPTKDSLGCLREIKKILKAGCQVIRLSLLHNKDLSTIPELLRLINEEGLKPILVADVHFASHLAYDACQFFDKIRINPGNFSDRPKNYNSKRSVDYNFEDGRDKLRAKIEPLAKNLLKFNRTLRIGVNHGSLSQRMMQKYGDSPKGMAESALEALDLFENQGVKNIVVSLKSSNPLVANNAYRLFAAYNKGEAAIPLHLGVTEAGFGDMARVKSIGGIGPLLLDGLGDTIRVSLTEDSLNEVAFAKKFISFINNHVIWQQQNLSATNQAQSDVVDPRKSKIAAPPDTNFAQTLMSGRLKNKAIKIGSLVIGDGSAPKIGLADSAKKLSSQPDFYYKLHSTGLLLTVEQQQLLLPKQTAIDFGNFTILQWDQDLYQFRKLYRQQYPLKGPVGLQLPNNFEDNDYNLELKLSALLLEGLLDFVLLPPDMDNNMVDRLDNILQATRIKLFETDYVACPSCGRTTFDLQKVSAAIKEKTKHLKGLKIAILGCMVNGPGEMADADFGYVGASNGSVDLYLGYKKVAKNIPSSQAVESLINLIKSENCWQDP